MSNRVIYSECSQPFWVEVAAQLFETAGLEPVYWVAASSMERHVRDRFPGAVFHSSLDAVRGIAPQACDSMPLPAVDYLLLNQMASWGIETLTMMNRLDTLGSLTYADRLRLYYRLLKYWSGVLECYAPKLVVFSTTPHTVYDYVLYRLCKLRGIQTVMFESTKMRGLVHVTASYDDRSQIPRAYAALPSKHVDGPVSLSMETETYLQGLTEEAYHIHDPLLRIPFYMHPEHNAASPGLGEIKKREKRPSRIMNNGHAALRLLWRRVFNAVNETLNGLTGTPPPNYLKQSGKKIEESHMTGWEYWRFKRQARREMKSLNKHYARLATELNLEEPYIYIPLNYQPERTTSPLGGAYVDQTLMVDIVAHSLPPNWLIYLKEHPTQFHPVRAFRAQSARNKEFYDDLISLPNVKLAPMHVSPFDLIDHARAVAVVGGTGGWEAVNRGKPALVFGVPWYVGCEGVFSVRTVKECSEAIARIAGGYAVDREKVRLFVKAVEQVSFRGYVEPLYQEVVGITAEQNIEAIVRALKQFWESCKAGTASAAAKQRL
jgi:hypothetical protein